MVDQAIRASQTIPEMFLHRVHSSVGRVAYEHETPDGWHAVTYGTYGSLVARAAVGLHTVGLGSGDCIAIWGETTPEWTIADLGGLAAGARVAGIYQTSSPEQAVYILQDSVAKMLCVDTAERLGAALEFATACPALQMVICWGKAQPPAEPNLAVLQMEELLRRGEQRLQENPGLYEELVAQVLPDMVAVLVYTSGTTGPPKGVMLTHRNCMTNARRIVDGQDIVEFEDAMVAFLPMSHVAEHTSNFLGRLYAGMKAYFCPDVTQLGRVLREKKPTILVGVPRLYEKIYQQIQLGIDHLPERRQRVVRWALAQGRAVADYRERQEPPPRTLAVKHAFADRLVLSKIKAELGGHLRVMSSGAAPMDVEIMHFFRSLGISFFEAYGLSECGGVSHINRPHAFKVGTVGRPVEGTECRLAADGEVLIRSEAIFRGYLNNDAATNEMVDPEGWLHTGDIGEIDAGGYLRITDRKKNLLITAGGKNVAPAPMEVLIKQEPVVSQVVVLGDRRPYLVALVSVSQEVITAEGLSPEMVEERIAAAVERANKPHARYEQVKKFHVIDGEFSIESGEMTPTMKLKRGAILSKHADAIEAMYAASKEGEEHAGSLV
jgi:long-chain acyl-CoA synthetase